jgi:hypothetical protein
MKNIHLTLNKKMWLAFWATIIILLIIYFSAIYKANEISKIQTTQDGKHVELSAEIAEIWKENSSNMLSAIDDELNSKAKSEIDMLIDEKIDVAFNKAYGQIPKFADFHYSVTGEYSEIVDILSGEMSNRVQEILFKQVGVEANLQNAFTDIADSSQKKIEKSIETTNYNIKIKINLSNNDINKFTKILELTTQDIKNRFRPLEYSTIRNVRQKSMNIVLAKIIGKKLAVKITAKTSVKTAAKAGSILGGAGTGAGTCAVGGPIAAGVCGVVAGVVTWFVVDKLIVEIDEHFNRDEFEQELRSMLDEQKLEIKKGLKDSYSTILTTLADDQKNRIKSGVIIPKDLINN